MMELTSKLEFDQSAFNNIKAQLSRGFDITPEVWDEFEDFVKETLRKRATDIVRYGVSPATKKWRKKMVAAGGTVKTIGDRDTPVLNSPRVGRRTGTFINALRTSDPEVVNIEISSGEGGIPNGRFSYKFDEEKFHNSYPLIFQDYLVGRGIVPPDGFLGFSEEAESGEIDRLMEKVYQKVASDLGFM